MIIASHHFHNMHKDSGVPFSNGSSIVSPAGITNWLTNSYNASTIKVWKTNEKSKGMNGDLHISCEWKPQLLSSIQLLNIIYGIWLPFFALTNNWLKQEAETIKCACEPGCWTKFSSILRSWDSSAFKEISKKSPKITIPNFRYFFLLLYQTLSQKASISNH